MNGIEEDGSKSSRGRTRGGPKGSHNPRNPDAARQKREFPSLTQEKLRTLVERGELLIRLGGMTGKERFYTWGYLRGIGRKRGGDRIGESIPKLHESHGQVGHWQRGVCIEKRKKQLRV